MPGDAKHIIVKRYFFLTSGDFKLKLINNWNKSIFYLFICSLYVPQFHITYAALYVGNDNVCLHGVNDVNDVKIES